MATIEERLRSDDIKELFWFLPLLERLLDVTALRRSSSILLDDKLARGYAFCIASLLWHAAESLIDTPELLDLREDRTLQRARQTGIAFHLMPAGSEVGRVVRKITMLYRPLLAVRSFDDVENCTNGEVAGWYRVMSSIFKNCYGLGAEGTRKQLDIALRLVSAQRLLERLQDARFLRIAFNHTYNKSRLMLAQWTPLPLTLDKQMFLEGYKLALSQLWERLFQVNRYSPLMLALMKSATWKQMDLLFEGFLEDIVKPYVKESNIEIEELQFRKVRKIPKRSVNHLASLPEEESARPSTVNEQLNEAFMWYPIFVVDEQWNAAAGFITALAGLTRLTKGKVNIIKLVHGQERQNTFSYGILLESCGVLIDSSRWWVFPECCTNYSGTGGMLYKEITERLTRLGRRIVLKEVHVDSSEFDDYMRSSTERNLKRENVALMNTLSNSRAVLLELLYALLMEKQGHRVIWRYRNSQVLGDSEIDVLTIDQTDSTTRIEIAKCTVTASEDDAKRLVKKRKLVSKNLTTVLKQVGKEPTRTAQLSTALIAFNPIRIRVDGEIETHSAEWIGQQCRDIGLNWREFRHLFS